MTSFVFINLSICIVMPTTMHLRSFHISTQNLANHTSCVSLIMALYVYVCCMCVCVRACVHRFTCMYVCVHVCMRMCELALVCPEHCVYCGSKFLLKLAHLVWPIAVPLCALYQFFWCAWEPRCVHFSRLKATSNLCASLAYTHHSPVLCMLSVISIFHIFNHT